MGTITLEQLAGARAIITALWVFRERIIKGVNGALDAKLKPLKDSTELVLKTQMSMMTHLIDGNHIDKMKELKKEVENSLIDKAF